MHQPTSEMPDLRRLATHERVAAMTCWLRARLGDEFVLDRWLSVLDQRLRFLSSPWAQRQMVGRFESDGAECGVKGGDAVDPQQMARECPVHSSTSVGCCIECAGVRRAVLGNVVYEELLALPTNAVPPAAGASAPASKPRRPRLADLLPMLDDRAQATRVRKRGPANRLPEACALRTESRMAALLLAGVP